MRNVVLLGSTGSIGTQTLDVIARNPGEFRVVALAAGGGRPELLAAQALEFTVEAVAVAEPAAATTCATVYRRVAEQRGLGAGSYRVPKLLTGPDAAAEVAGWPADVVVNAMTGSIGLAPTLAALAAGTTLALANKESLIVGGPLVQAAARPGQIVPVDSEHSAIAQCLRAGRPAEVRRLVLTASGGPFRGRSRAELADVSVEEALAHPTWNMGPVVTVNSATLVNKGLEVIEAHLLFRMPFAAIEVVVHPQSVVHSMVEFADGSTLAQCSPPDMRLPISVALNWPTRVPDAAPPMDWSRGHRWDFEPLDETAFPAVALARSAGATGGTAPAVYNAANEEAVEAFLAGRLPFPRIVDTVAEVLADVLAEGSAAGVGTGVGNSLTLADVLQAERWARHRARRLTGASLDRNEES